VRIAIYAGTFDPPTLGHFSVIERAARLFDRLWIVVAKNPQKQPLFTDTERVSMLAEMTAGFAQVAVEKTDGYVVELARRVGARYLIRGVRGVTDVEAEIALSRLNSELAPEIETVFVPASRDLADISSSRLKQLARSGHDVSAFCAPNVLLRLEQWAESAPREREELQHVG
jgi:pantetheine-phosphate adenylyltransferase